MIDILQKYLQEIGLTDKEAMVYASLLQVDHASVLELARKTKIKRTTIYLTLESLAKKGLISEAQLEKKVHYQAEPPERLESYVQNQKIVLDERAKRLQEIIPQLKSIQRGQGERPVVKFFEGKGGALSASEELFQGTQGGGVAYIVYPRDLLEEVFTKDDLEKFRKIRVGKNIKSKALYNYKKGEIPSDVTGERIKLDEKKYPITSDITVYKDRVRIITLGKKISAIFIRSQDAATTIKSLIDLIFSLLKK